MYEVYENVDNKYISEKITLEQQPTIKKIVGMVFFGFYFFEQGYLILANQNNRNFKFQQIIEHL
jgi:hypothetical protein